MMNCQLITNDKEPEDIDLTGSEFMFFSKSSVQRCLSWHYAQKYSLDYFEHQVSKKPTNLLSHIQRIFFCYHENLSEQLYASLLDFFLILNGYGKEARLRMFQGSKSRLSPEHRKQLSRLLNGEIDSVDKLQGNRYSLLDKGLSGTSNLISRVSASKSSEKLDALKIAQDFIEYSQLEEARVVLEIAIMEKLDSEEIHEELLSLYHSTEDIANFQKMYTHVKQQDSFMLKTWHDFNSSLVESINEG
jgi:hypothetical protein